MNSTTSFLAMGLVFANLSVQSFAQDWLQPPPYSEMSYHDRFLESQWKPASIPDRTIFVSPSAAYDGVGTKDSPFGSLTQARDSIRKLQSESGLPAGGMEVVLLPGVYHLAEPFQLTRQDSGTEDAPIIYRAEIPGSVRLSTGTPIELQDAQRVEHAALLGRLHPSAQGKVVMVHLPDELLSGIDHSTQFAFDGQLLRRAQWPNLGYCHIDQIIDKGPTTRWLKPGEKPPAASPGNPIGAKFTTVEPLSPLLQNEFRRTQRMQVEGYLHNDWYFQREPVGAIQDGVIQLQQATRYGVADKIKSIPRRIRLVNVLSELDEPGEWYFDATDQILYLWPPTQIDPPKTRLSMLSPSHQGMMTMEEVSFCVFRDLIFEDSGRCAVSIEGGTNVLIAGCIFRNGTHRGVDINGGSRHGITGCEFHDLESAFSMRGGDFRTLERCYHYATNNEVHSCRRRGYGVVGINGVGMYFAHNVLHDMNGALSFNAVDTLMEFNEFYNIGYEMGDFNVAYCGAKWHTMNNVLRFNFVHHLFEPGGHPVIGFRNDDGGMGLQIYGNVFYRSGRGAAQFHGPLNSFRNNITIKTHHMWWTNKGAITQEEVQAEWKGLERFGRDLPHGDKGDNLYLMDQLLGEKGWSTGVWKEEFPMLSTAIQTNPFAQTFSVVANNYVHRVRVPFHIHGGSGTVEGMESKETGKIVDLPSEGHFELPEEISMEAFEDLAQLDLRFRDGFQPTNGFQPIPFGRIGLVRDEFRDSPVDRSYRADVYKRYMNESGGHYDPEVINARYRVLSNESNRQE
jgi:hypothetical protein